MRKSSSLCFRRLVVGLSLYKKPQQELGNMWMAYTCTHLPSPETKVESRDRKFENSTPNHCTRVPQQKPGSMGMAYTCIYLPSPEDVSVAKCNVNTRVPAQQPNRYPGKKNPPGRVMTSACGINGTCGHLARRCGGECNTAGVPGGTASKARSADP